MLNVNTAFETYVHHTVVDLDSKKIVDCILEFSKFEPAVELSNNGGYQGHNFVNQELEQAIFSNLPPCYKSIPKAKLQAWVNINKKGHWNDVHCHVDEGVIISGVWYGQVPYDSGSLRLYDPRSAPSTSLYSKYFTPHHGNYARIEPKENLLLFFPPWLFHLVEPNNSDADRISVAFNVILSYD